MSLVYASNFVNSSKSYIFENLELNNSYILNYDIESYKNSKYQICICDLNNNIIVRSKIFKKNESNKLYIFNDNNNSISVNIIFPDVFRTIDYFIKINKLELLNNVNITDKSISKNNIKLNIINNKNVYDNKNLIENRYIIDFNKNIVKNLDEINNFIEINNLELIHKINKYQYILKIKNIDINKLRKNKIVNEIILDRKCKILGFRNIGEVNRKLNKKPKKFIYSDIVDWYINRVKSLDNSIVKPLTLENQNLDCNVFVIDTGCDLTHRDLNIVNAKSYTEDVSLTDQNGHGTAVASIIGGIINNDGIVGIAPNVKIHSYKVLNSFGFGNLSSVIAAINDVLLWKKQNPNELCIINLSLGGPDLNILKNTVRNAIKNNIYVICAAGNENRNILTTSPANTPEAITVGSYGKTNIRSNFSNFGSLLDIYAPGENIYAADINNSYFPFWSGTSFSAPIVSGIIALLLLKNKNKKLSNRQLTTLLLTLAKKTTFKQNPRINNKTVNKTTNISVFAGNF